MPVKKAGTEKRVDVELDASPLKVTGFFQDMQGHANGDMDGRYLNLSVAETRKVKGKKPLTPAHGPA